MLRSGDGRPRQSLLGSFSFSTEGLGLAPGNPLNLIQASETPEECDRLGAWFDAQWSALTGSSAAKADLVATLRDHAAHRGPSRLYAQILHNLFRTERDELDEERVVKSATGIRDTEVWKRLFKFQRDGVVGAIDKLERFGGCIIADSVGPGKNFEALAIIIYHELPNDRVLVLFPKRLHDNWNLYRANDRRNFLAGDRFNYDILNHTDLSRDGGLSGDIDLAHVNWGNYDLIVIDESHNFRNKRSPRQGGETRYDRLMQRIVRDGVKIRVLMLSATPVNNCLADLRNQIAFATEGDDAALPDDPHPRRQRTSANTAPAKWQTREGRQIGCPQSLGTHEKARGRRAAFRRKSPCSLHQQPRRTRLAHEQGQAEGIGLFPNHSVRRSLLPNLQLPADHGQPGIQSPGRHTDGVCRPRQCR